ncbi:septum formation initiator family protein [Geodermatophilus marinus]|uniref:septum formation initiator family protein n=1 Tax=Geodermatophilus sp. LHW52908 TaxID=2303986 RepID=UPI000E3E1195|nr:septum formation initiator family protein [Geodermatophilus sp. LHW52908]RFU22810.1 septum formation initiator family protein [Geodermatophilus sp. LHW52908]
MSGPRARRGGRRATGRPLASAASRPVPAGVRSGAGGRPDQRRPGRRTARGATAVGQPRRPLFTGRAVLLAGLVLLLALTLAGPVRQYLSGRAELARLAAEGAALDQRIEDLQDELDRQSDPGWTAREARDRLRYVLPGDRLVVVVDGETAEGDAGTLPAQPAAEVPWYDALMGSLATADADTSGGDTSGGDTADGSPGG